MVDGWVKAGFLSAPSEHSPLLRVNAEARYEAQKRYGPFGIPTAGRRQPGLNVNIDVLWLPHPQDVEGFVYTIWQSTVPWLLLGYRRLALPWLFFEKALSHIDMRMEERISTRFRLMPMDRWLWTLLMISLIDEMILVVGQEDIPSYTTSMSMPAAVPRSQVLDTLLEESLPGIKVECLEKALTRVMREYKKWWILWLEIMGELLFIPRIALCLTKQVPTYGSSAARFLRYQRQTKIVRNWRTPSIKIRQMKNGF